MSKCPRSGVSARLDRRRALPGGHGVDDEPAAGGDQATAARYRVASKSAKAGILDELCALTGWQRDHARRALRAALGPRPARRRPRPPVYGEDVMAGLRKAWAVLDAPAGKRLAPFLPEIVARLRAAASWPSTTPRPRSWARCRPPRSTAGWHRADGDQRGVSRPDQGHRLRQRRRVHQRPAAPLLRAGEDHLHPVAGRAQERRRTCRAEELVGGAPGGRLPPLRHPGRAGASQ